MHRHVLILPIFTMENTTLSNTFEKNLRHALLLTNFKSWIYHSDHKLLHLEADITNLSGTRISSLKWGGNRSPMREYQRHDIFMGILLSVRQTSLHFNYMSTFLYFEKKEKKITYRIIQWCMYGFSLKF